MRDWDVTLVDVSDADAFGRCTVSVYDRPNESHLDVPVNYAPDNGVEIAAASPLHRYGFRVCRFVERDAEICELVAARVREAIKAHDPR